MGFDVCVFVFVVEIVGLLRNRSGVRAVDCSLLWADCFDELFRIDRLLLHVACFLKMMPTDVFDVSVEVKEKTRV